MVVGILEDLALNRREGCVSGKVTLEEPGSTILHRGRAEGVGTGSLPKMAADELDEAIVWAIVGVVVESDNSVAWVSTPNLLVSWLGEVGSLTPVVSRNLAASASPP